MPESTTWLRNCWQVAAFGHELGRTVLARTFLGEPVVMFRTPEGEPAALKDRCPHRLLPLSAGTLDGPVLRCGYHGMEFAADGRCVMVPGQDRAPAAARVRAYPLVERYSLVWIWMGDPALADPALVPDVHWIDDPAWEPCIGYHHMKADYRLVTDNLLDLSHETYVHQRTIGNAAVAEAPARVKAGGRIIRADREMLDIVPPPYFARILETYDRIDRWQSAVYMPPGMHMTEAGVHRTGTPRTEAFVGRVLHMLTPETETSAHYFWSMNRNYRLGDEALTEYIRDAVQRTLDEDKVVLELQMESILAEKPERFPPIAILVDAAPVQARRMLAKLVADEQADAQTVASPVPLAHDPPGWSPDTVAA